VPDRQPPALRVSTRALGPKIPAASRHAIERRRNTSPRLRRQSSNATRRASPRASRPGPAARCRLGERIRRPTRRWLTTWRGPWIDAKADPQGRERTGTDGDGQNTSPPPKKGHAGADGQFARQAFLRALCVASPSRSRTTPGRLRRRRHACPARSRLCSRAITTHAIDFKHIVSVGDPGDAPYPGRQGNSIADFQSCCSAWATFNETFYEDALVASRALSRSRWTSRFPRTPTAAASPMCGVPASRGGYVHPRRAREEGLSRSRSAIRSRTREKAKGLVKA